MAEKKFKRKTYIINKRFQFQFIASFLLVIVISLLVFSACFAVFYWVRYMAGDNIFKEFIFIQRQVTTTTPEGEEIPTSEMLPAGNRFDMILPPILINNLVLL